MKSAVSLNKSRRGVSGCLLLVGALFIALVAYAVPATEVSEDTFEAWTLRCERPEKNAVRSCIMLQNLVLQAGGHTILQFSIGIPPNEKTPTVLISLPLGISLPPGISIRIDDGDTRNFPVERCEPDGCRAGLKLRAQTVEQLRRGAQLEITFFDNQRQPITMPLSLTGFSSAYAALEAASSASAPQ